jgi:hypothetical protein
MVGVVAFLGLGAANAGASSGTLANAACQKGSTTGTVEWRWEGMYNSNPNEPLGLDCSVPQYDDRVDRVEVYYDDSSTTEEIVCSLKMVDSSGFVDETRPAQKSGRAFTDPHGTFRWGNFSAPGSIPYVGCTVPKSPTAATACGVQGMNVSKFQ